MIQIKVLKNFNGMLKNHIYNFSNDEAKKLVEHKCAIRYDKDDNGKYIPVGIHNGTGDQAIYYSKDRDELNNTLAPPINIPKQLHNCRLLHTSDDKAPFLPAWQKSNNTINNKNFMEWIYDHEKYGVACGWDSTNEHFLVVIDFDDEITQRECLDNSILPETFTCKTARKGLYHLYFYVTDEVKKWKISTKDKETLADIQAATTQVIGPGSRIPDGRCYEVVKDIPIATIPPSLLHKALDQFNYQKVEESLQETSAGLTLSDFEKSFGDDKALQEVRSRLKIVDILHDASIPTNRNPTKCPFHTSKGGKCLGFDNNKGIWSCFHCLEKGTAIDLWMKIHNVDTFIEAKKQLCEKFNIEDTYIPPPIVEPVKNAKPNVQLPQDNRTVLDFAANLATHFKECNEIFYKVDEKCIVEVTEYLDKQLKQLIVGFNTVSPGRLFNIIEWKVNTFNTIRVKKQDVMVRKSANEQMIKLVSTNQAFLKCLHEIKRLLNYPIPFIDSDGKLIIPDKGYDSRYQAYFTPNTPELFLMSVDEAKMLLYDAIGEFCFKDQRDIDMAIAYIITPMCRGLYRKSTARTPLFIIQANRERAGKDYLAGVVGILYEGRAIDDTPLVTGDKGDSNNDEWRKKFTTALRAGRRRIHSSNNRGFLNSAVLEQFLTSEVWIDRQLGGNVSLELNNEVDVSLSANIGLTYTPDLWFRARPINLFYGEENPNERVYKRTDLWGYIGDNRGKLLSAIYTLIKIWFDAGRPKSTIPFTSFPEWSRVVGGIMEYHNIGNPCVQIEDDGIGGDKETQSMKELFKFMAEYQHNHQETKGFTVNDIRRIIIEAQSSEDFEGFAGWDLNDKSYQTKFGIQIKRYVNRSFNCKSLLLGENSKVSLIIAIPNERSVRILYMFKTDKPITVAPIIPVDPISLPPAVVEEFVGQAPDVVNAVDNLVKELTNNKLVNIDYLISVGIPESIILKCKRVGMIYEPKPGWVGLL